MNITDTDILDFISNEIKEMVMIQKEINYNFMIISKSGKFTYSNNVPLENFRWFLRLAILKEREEK